MEEYTFEQFINMVVRRTLVPVRILKNDPATIVFWRDGSKTVVKRGEETAPNDYEAFTAALAIKVFGNNSHLKKMIQKTTVEQKPKIEKKAGDSE